MASEDQSGTSARMTKQRAGGLKRFLIVVLVLFTAIILLLWALAALAPDGGLLPFDYEGF